MGLGACLSSKILAIINGEQCTLLFLLTSWTILRHLPQILEFFTSSDILLRKWKSLSRVQLFTIPWTVVYQASLSMGFSRQEYWSGLPFPAPGDLPNPGIKPRSPALQADALPSEPPGMPLLGYMSSHLGPIWMIQNSFPISRSLTKSIFKESLFFAA